MPAPWRSLCRGVPEASGLKDKAWIEQMGEVGPESCAPFINSVANFMPCCGTGFGAVAEMDMPCWGRPRTCYQGRMPDIASGDCANSERAAVDRPSRRLKYSDSILEVTR